MTPMTFFLKNPLRIGLILSLSFLLLACGFHLRGLEKMPPILNKLYIETDIIAPALLPSLKSSLQNNGVILMTEAGQATSLLLIQNFQTSKQLISLSGVTEAGQYQLTTSVDFTLEDSKSNTLLGPIHLSAERQYSTNATQILSNSSIEFRLNQQMSQELANKILSYLARYKS